MSLDGCASHSEGTRSSPLYFGGGFGSGDGVCFGSSTDPAAVISVSVAFPNLLENWAAWARFTVPSSILSTSTIAKTTAGHSGGARLCGSSSDGFTLDEFCVCSKGKEGERNENFGEHFQFR